MSLSIAVKESKPTTIGINSLPVELKIHILAAIEDLSTLSAIVHASSAFHKIYAAHRPKILTQITLGSLKARGIVFTTPIQWAEVCFKTGKQYREPLREEQPLLLSAFQSINKRLQSDSKTPMVFDVQQCLCLLKIAHMLAFRVGNSQENIFADLDSEGPPEYPFLPAPNIYKRFKKADKRIRSSSYPCGMNNYEIVFVRDFDSKQRGSIDTHTLLSHEIETGAH